MKTKRDFLKLLTKTLILFPFISVNIKATEEKKNYKLSNNELCIINGWILKKEDLV